MVDEFIDRYGDPPKPVMGLVNIALVRNSAAALGIREITQRGEKAIFYMKSLSPECAPRLYDKYGSRLKFIQGDKPGFSIDLSAKKNHGGAYHRGGRGAANEINICRSINKSLK